MYLFVPVIFVDTTNIWKEKSKYKRMMVSFAGPFSDFAFISLLYLLLSFFVENKVYSQFIAFLIILYFWRAIFNLNPFLKLDGYYIFMDYLEIPNLRQNSLQFLKYFLFGTPNSANFKFSKKKSIIFFIFGLLSFLVTLLFIMWLLMYVFRSFINLKV